MDWYHPASEVGPSGQKVRLAVMRTYHGRFPGVSKPRPRPGMEPRWRYFFTGSEYVRSSRSSSTGRATWALPHTAQKLVKSVLAQVLAVRWKTRPAWSRAYEKSRPHSQFRMEPIRSSQWRTTPA